MFLSSKMRWFSGFIDALQDFGKVPQIPQPKRLNPSGGTVQGGSDDMNQVWTEEFIKEGW